MIHPETRYVNNAIMRLSTITMCFKGFNDSLLVKKGVGSPSFLAVIACAARLTVIANKNLKSVIKNDV